MFPHPLEEVGGRTEARDGPSATRRPPAEMFHPQWQTGSMTYHVIMTVGIKIYLGDI